MSSNRLIYDDCASEQQITDSTSLLNYYFYKGKFENCSECNVRRLELNEPPRKGKLSLVEIESDLDGRNRPATKCDNHKFSKNCDINGFCINGKDPRIITNNPPDVCFYPGLAWNNIKKVTDPGYRLPDPYACDLRMKIKNK
jgi:hypothetical protein